jgi:MFS family permease
MGGLLTVPAFLERFPQVDIISSSSFHNAWVTGTCICRIKLCFNMKIYVVKHILTGLGLTVGVWNLGCIVSAVLAIFISDSLGRRRTLLLGITLWAIGEIIQTSSYSFAQFVVGRGIAGFGMTQALHYLSRNDS